MPVIAVINRKGGSGKSTLATHLAAWLAREGLPVLLGDSDSQQSSKAWLKRRDAALPAIVPWTMGQQTLKMPPGITHVVQDTPGALHGFELAKVIMSADAVVMPVCSSMFDREAAAACYAELMTLPRVTSGRCKIGVVGMRVDARTHSAQVLRDWADGLQIPFLGVLRETQNYVRSLENGMTVFDLPQDSHTTDRAQWEPILQWLRPIVQLATPTPVVAPPVATLQLAVKPITPVDEPERIHTALAASLIPAQETFVHGDRLSLCERSAIPAFLLRH